MKRQLTILALSLGLLTTLSAQQMPPYPVDPAVRIGHLDNGLTYYIRHNEEPKDQAHFYIAQKVGSILEDEPQRGLAHFLEHMCFNGTEHFPGNGLIKYLESIGVKFGADLNAYTSIDETVYNIDNVPVAAPGAIDSCLWILHDWADGLLLEADDIDHERGVIHEEWRSRQNAQMRMYDQILPKIYPGNKYAERMPIGLIEVIDNFPYQAIRDYYEKWYRPDQQGIVVVGDIDVDEIEAKIRDIFGPIEAPADPAERYYVQVADNAEPIVAIATDREQQHTMSMVSLKHDPFPAEMKSNLSYFLYSYSISMIESMLGQRIDEIRQLPEPPFVAAGIGDGEFFLSKTKSAFSGTVITTEDGIVEGLTSVYREMLRAIRGGFTATEYERARSNYLTQIESAYNERSKTKSVTYCNQYVRNFIDNEPIPGIENTYTIAGQLAANIPVEMINTMLSQLTGPDNMVVVCMLPDKEGVSYPSEEELLSALRAVEAEDIPPYQDDAVDEPLVSELPTPGRVVKTAPAPFGYTKYTLSNGATVYVKSTDFKADQIVMSAVSEGGLSLYSDSEALNLSEVSSVYDLGGLGNFSTTALRKALSGKNASVGMYVDTYTEGFNGYSTPKDLETLLQLTYLYFTAPRMDEDAFKSYVSRCKASMANVELNPNTALRDTINSVVYHNHPRAVRVKADDFDRLDYGRMMQIASERLANAADFSFVFTGNVDTEVLIPLVERYIGSLPAGGKKEKRRDVKLNISRGEMTASFEKEMQIPMATAIFLESGKAKYTLKDNMSLDIASQILNIIYTEEIREKEGGTYGVSVNSGTKWFPKSQGMLQISYSTDPDKVEHLNSRIMEILRDFAANGPSEANLAKVKEYKSKKHAENLRDNSYYSSALVSYLTIGKDFLTYYDTTLESITTEDVRRSVEKILKQGNSISIVMKGTESK